MLETLKEVLALFSGNAKNNILTGVIMVSAIIVFIGLLKPLLFDRIKVKALRKAIIALSEIAICFTTVAVAFWVNHFNFHYYLYASAGLFIATVITYWFYENTCLRNLIHKVGSITLGKIYGIAVGLLKPRDKQEIKAEIKKVNTDIKKAVHNELAPLVKKAASHDKELNNL